MDTFDYDNHNQLLQMELKLIKIAKEYQLCKDLHIALLEAAAALNWAQLELRKINNINIKKQNNLKRFK